MKIALLTFDGRNSESQVEEIIATELQRMGADAHWVVWNRLENADAWDGIVFRSTWDYVQKLDEFRAFVEDLKMCRTRVLNAPDIILWNLSKSYLEELSREGIPTLPTLTLTGDIDAGIGRIEREIPKGKIVLKPQISAGAYRTQVIESGDREAMGAYLREGLGHGPVMAQPFVESIRDTGEHSLLYWNRGQGPEFSHAVSKVPVRGDFRVQQQYGGVTSSIEPEAESRDLAERLLSRFQPRDWLYARVDLVQYQNQWQVIELEMIEPFLFLPYAPGSERKFAEALISAVSA